MRLLLNLSGSFNMSPYDQVTEKLNVKQNLGHSDNHFQFKRRPNSSHLLVDPPCSRPGSSL